MTGVNDAARPELRGINGRERRLFRIATTIWAATMSWLAFRPSRHVETGLPWDKLHHAAAFLLLTVLVGRGWPRLGPIALSALMLAAGIGIELIQGLPAIGRDADIWDVVADAVGIALGLVVLRWWATRPIRE